VQKVVVVTGSAKGLGKAMAIALSKDGFTVAVHYNRSRKEAEEVLAKIKHKSPKSILVEGNLTDENQVLSAFNKITKSLGRVDLLVNNVGSFIYKKFAETTVAEFKETVETNIYSSYFCSQLALKLMRKQ